MTRALRSLLAFLALMASFVLAGLLQRVVIWPLIALRPSARGRIMDRFMHAKAGLVLLLVRAGGARLVRSGTVPTGSPVLILMNHQSLLDIPTAVVMCAPHVPLFVTRRLYARYIPVVSLMLRIREDPLVDPDRDTRGSIAALKRAARAGEHGIVLVPEGHRTRTGEIEAFELAGLRVLLGERRMPVYLLVTDGFWTCRHLVDFVFDMPGINGRTEVLGPFDPPASPAAFTGFAERMRETLVAHLQAMRRADH